MIKAGFTKILRSIRKNTFATVPRIQYIEGASELCSSTKDVQLRGVRIQGNYTDLPNMIFFPDLFDQAENWIPFFTGGATSVLDYRNVYILYPRNFGSSDWCNDKSDDYGESLAADVERFMYQHKITMATLAGHGFGAKTAMVTGTLKPDLVTGILSFDYAPQDYTYFRAADNLRNTVKSLEQIAKNPFLKKDFEKILEEKIPCKKTQELLSQNLQQIGQHDFVLKYNNTAVSEQFDELINWRKIEYGLFGGRVCFVFPEYSNYVFLNSNTLSIMKVCVKAQGYGHDIQSVMTESDNPEQNHWIYEYPELTSDFQKQAVKFLSNYDGVDVRYMNKAEYLSGHGVPVRGSNERHDRYAGDIVPPVFYHNWKFSDRADLK